MMRLKIVKCASLVSLWNAKRDQLLKPLPLTATIDTATTNTETLQFGTTINNDLKYLLASNEIRFSVVKWAKPIR